MKKYKIKETGETLYTTEESEPKTIVKNLKQVLNKCFSSDCKDAFIEIDIDQPRGKKNLTKSCIKVQATKNK